MVCVIVADLFINLIGTNNSLFPPKSRNTGFPSDLRFMAAKSLIKKVSSSTSSIDSPMARALLGKEEDDEFTVKTEAGVREWWINRIWYDATDKL